jgi:hypothetical protein
MTNREETVSDKDGTRGSYVYELYCETISNRNSRGYDKNREYSREITYYGVTNNPKQRRASHQYSKGYMNVLHENLSRAEAIYLEGLYAWKYQQEYGCTPREMKDR